MKDPGLYPQQDTDDARRLMRTFFQLEAKLLKLSPIKRFLFHNDEAYEYSQTYRSIVSFTDPVVGQLFTLRKGTLYF